MSTIQKEKKSPNLTISKHALDRIEKRLGMSGHLVSDLKARIGQALLAGKYIERQLPNRSVFRCLMETDRKRREELFIVVSDDNCVLTIIDKHNLFDNRAKRWNA